MGHTTGSAPMSPDDAAWRQNYEAQGKRAQKMRSREAGWLFAAAAPVLAMVTVWEIDGIAPDVAALICAVLSAVTILCVAVSRIYTANFEQASHDSLFGKY